MKPILLPLLCLIGVAPVILQTILHKYTLIQTRMTWVNAKNYCRTYFEDLATVQNDNDWVRLSAEAKRNALVQPAWLGLYNDIDSWRWSYNEVPLKNQTFIGWWGGGEPNNQFGDQSCAVVDSSGNWMDYSCILPKPFICYDDELTAPECYVSIVTPMNWSAAQSYCRTYHTDLATAPTSTENNLLRALTTLAGSWIGLYRDKWKWSDGENVTNVPWKDGQPDNLYGTENFATVNSGLFQDELGNTLLCFFCHVTRPARFQQTVRLQINSDLNLNDPTVLTSFVNLLKQKLIIHGMMKNTTVTWRPQPDGLIFHKKRTDQV